MKNNDLKWFLYDAKEHILGRLATQVAVSLRGKNEVSYAANCEPTNKVVVINCFDIKTSGNKEIAKRYFHHSGFHGGIKEISLKDQRVKDATKILRDAVKGMLPKNKLITPTLKNLYLYNNDQHPHTTAKFCNLK